MKKENRDQLISFIDIEKAFVKITSNDLWKTLKNKGMETKTISINIRTNNEPQESGEFETKIGVK